MPSSDVCVPGQRISLLDEAHTAGDGTYVRSGYIYSSLAGFVHTRETDDGKLCMHVKTEIDQSVVPFVGTLVTARVTNVNPRFCKCAIIGVDNTLLRETFRGMVRREDVKATEKDRVEMYKSFRPGDILLARVISLGDSQSYILSTAENELGVVIATSEAGVSMVPISWCEMKCPKMLTKEYRKVAKVQPQHIQYSKKT